MTRTVLRHMAFVAATCVVLAGCSTTQPAKLYALAPIAPPAVAPVPAAAPAVAISVAPVHLAEYLDRQEIVRRLGPNELRRDDGHHWAERLSAALTRTLAIDLSVLTGRDIRVIADQVRPGPSLLVVLDVQRFEIAADGNAVLAGRWVAVDVDGAERAGGALSVSQAVAASDTKQDVSAEVAALNRCLSDAATTIAQGLART